jgi:hypothetical protein
VVDIPEAYEMVLSRDWYAKLNGYFATYWSHFWLPYKGKPNKINVEHKRYMENMVTNLNDRNELVIFSK